MDIIPLSLSSPNKHGDEKGFFRTLESSHGFYFLSILFYVFNERFHLFIEFPKLLFCLVSIITTDALRLHSGTRDKSGWHGHEDEQ